MGRLTLVLPEIAKASASPLGITLKWINPFDNPALLEIKASNGNIIYSMYINRDDIVQTPQHVLELLYSAWLENYTVEVTEIPSNRKKNYSMSIKNEKEEKEESESSD